MLLRSTKGVDSGGYWEKKVVVIQDNNIQHHPLTDFLKDCLSSPTGGHSSPKGVSSSAGITPSITNVPVDTIQ